MVAKADVVVENYRPDVKDRLGINYDALAAINPASCWARSAASARPGPMRERPGFDQIAQGMGGLMSVTGLPGQGPVRVGIPVADLTAGLYTAIGILVALLEREQTGKGRWVHTSLLEAMVAMMDFQATRWTMTHEVPKQAGNDHPTTVPTGLFRTKDGLMNLAGGGQEMWNRIVETLGIIQQAKDPAFATDKTRAANREKTNALLQSVLETDTSRELDRPAEQGRRALRAGLCDGPGLRRPAGEASRDRMAGGASGARHGEPGAGADDPGRGAAAAPADAGTRRAYRRGAGGVRHRRRGAGGATAKGAV